MAQRNLEIFVHLYLCFFYFLFWWRKIPHSKQWPSDLIGYTLQSACCVWWLMLTFLRMSSPMSLGTPIWRGSFPLASAWNSALRTALHRRPSKCNLELWEKWDTVVNLLLFNNKQRWARTFISFRATDVYVRFFRAVYEKLKEPTRNLVLFALSRLYLPASASFTSLKG